MTSCVHRSHTVPHAIHVVADGRSNVDSGSQRHERYEEVHIIPTTAVNTGALCWLISVNMLPG